MEANTTIETVNGWYENFMFGPRNLVIDKIGFFNLGYWKGITDSLELAQINLIETLADFLKDKGGNVLDIACGKGASTKFLTKYFNPADVTGINISEKQLSICKLLAPECNFKLMDATALTYADETFDCALCIEAAPHFLTRQRFFEEAYRVLKPGGRLAMSDMLYDHYLLDLLGQSHPKENFLPGLDDYRQSLAKAGFRYLRVEDSTEYSIVPFHRHALRQAEKRVVRTGDYRALKDAMDAAEKSKHCIACCMVYAIK